MGYFRNKTVWITGASSGIGEALAYQLAAQGANLIVSARNIDKLQAVAERCGTATTRVLPLDLEQVYSLAQKTQEALSIFNGIDIVVHCGGFSQRSMAHQTDIGVYARLINVHFLGVAAISNALLPHFFEKKSGQFVAISSLVGKFGSPLRTGYSAAKHALQGYFDSLRAETAQHGVRVTVVCPGYIKTDVSVNALSADGTQHKKMDKNQAEGMSAELCAKKILLAVAAQKKEVYIGGKEILGVYIKRFFPFFMDKILQNQVLNKKNSI